MRRLAFGLAMLGLLLAAPAAAGSNDGRPPAGTPIMRIVIPSIHLNMKVVEGADDGTEDGYYPTHYRSTNWPGEGETVAISAHHFTHALPGAAGGPFLRLNELRAGDVIYLHVLTKFGDQSVRYRVTGQREFYCGPSWADARYCTRALQGFTKLRQPKLILTTCIGDGHTRRFLYAFPQQP
jgi:LPXTG-site transpeptidase (sortase) family protein